MKLFSDISEVQKYITVANGTTLTSLETKEQPAFERFMKPFISQQFFDVVVEAYEEDPEDEYWAPYFEAFQRAMAYFMLYLYIPEGALNISDNGITVFRNENQAPASDAKLEALRSEFLTSGFVALETLLEFLEENKGDSEIEEWTENAYAKYKELFINTSVDFKNYINISGRRTFIAITPQIKNIERKVIKGALGSALYETIKEVIADPEGTISPEIYALWDKIKPVVAYLSMAKALLELSLRESEYGITLTTANMGDGALTLNPADLERINLLKNQYESEGMSALKDLEDFLFDNADDYEDYNKPEERPGPTINKPCSPNFYL
jgi:hypothetical protein